MKNKRKNKNCYMFLLLIILLFAALICVFGITKAQPVNAATADMPQMTKDNSKLVFRSSASSASVEFVDMQNVKYNTLIYYFDVPITSSKTFYFETYVNFQANYANDGVFYNGCFYNEVWSDFNVENSRSSYVNKRDIKPVYYVQIRQPIYIGPYLYPPYDPFEKTANITKMDFYYKTFENTSSGSQSVKHYGKLLYEIKGTDETISNNVIDISNFNHEKINNIYDILEEPIKKYNVTFYGYNNETLISYIYEVENNQIINGLSFSEMYNNAINSINTWCNRNKDYGQYSVYYFKSFDIPLTDMQEFKDYSIHANIDYCPYVETQSNIYFYGSCNDLIYSSVYNIRSNGRDWYLASANTLSQIYSMAEYNANTFAGVGNYKLKVFKGFDIPYSQNMECLTTNLIVHAIFDYPNKFVTINICDKDKNLIETRVVESGTIFSDLNLNVEKFYLYKFDSFYTFDLNDFNAGYGVVYNDTIIYRNLDIFPNYEYIGVEIKIFNADCHINSIFKEIGEIITENDLDLININPGSKIGYVFDKWTRTDYYRKHLEANCEEILVNNIYSVINDDTVEIVINAIFSPYKIESNNLMEIFFVDFIQPILIILACIFVFIILLVLIKKIIFR